MQTIDAGPTPTIVAKYFLIILMSAVLFGCSLPDCDDKTGERNNCTGSVTYTDGATYVGDWKDGKRSGQGTYTFADGRTYVGDWKDGNQTGQATFTWADGRTYVGDWKDGKMTGQGTSTYADGRTYVGDWKDDKRSGQGTFTWADGRTHVGDWKDDKRSGQGTYTWSGGKYVGDWKDGKMTGQGTYTYADGTKESGNFINGIYQATAAEKKAKLAREFPKYAVFSCSFNDYHSLLAGCLGGAVPTSLELKNGNDYGIYRGYELDKVGKESGNGFVINLKKNYSLEIQNSHKFSILGVKIYDRATDQLLFEKQVTQWGTIRVSN